MWFTCMNNVHQEDACKDTREHLPQTHDAV